METRLHAQGTSLPGVRKHQQLLGKGGVFRFTRKVARLEREVVPLSFFDVSFQPRLLLHEVIMRSLSMDDCADAQTKLASRG